MSTFALRIATPTRDVFSGMVDHVSLNTPDGRAGFLRGALARIAVLSAGTVEVTVGDEKLCFECADGIFGISADGMTVVTADCNDCVETDGEAVTGRSVSGRQYKYAKARIAASLIKINAKKFPEETF